MKRFSNLAIALVIISALLIIIGCTTYKIGIGKVSDRTEIIQFEVKEGQTFSTIGDELKKSNLIRSQFFYKLYIKLFQVKDSLNTGIYELKENMGVEKIVEQFKLGSTINPNVVTITFKEGLNMRQIASLVAKNTNHTEEEFINTMEDETYLDELISNYWFLTEEIKDKQIYYPLEGYLFPDTYQFQDRDVKIKDIIKVMLDHMDKKLKKYQDDINNVKEKYTIHDLLTLASLVELEAPSTIDRASVAGLFYNRLTHNWSLGSDVTTYYASKVTIGERDLYQREINDYNAYNTRNTKMAGKLPVSPVCNPGIESIEAAIKPTNHDYYYFVSDKNKKVYFTKTETEHNKIIQKLKNEGLWYEY